MFNFPGISSIECDASMGVLVIDTLNDMCLLARITKLTVTCTINLVVFTAEPDTNPIDLREHYLKEMRKTRSGSTAEGEAK
jgi:hypothetical protein